MNAICAISAGWARNRALGLVSGLILGLGAAAAPSASAQSAEPPQWAYQMSHDLMSPYCPGRTLAECPSPQAGELRLWILTQASSGASRDEIEASLIERFGDQVRSAPRAEGFGLAAYVFPLLGFALGGAAVVLVLRRLVARTPAAVPGAGTPAAAGPVDPELERLLDEELARD